MRGGSLMLHARNKYSQNGEDGVLAEVFRRLDLLYGGCFIGTFVEFGVGDGVVMSNTLALAEQGWQGVWIEQNEESWAKAKKLGDSFEGRVEVLHGTVGYGAEDNIDQVLDGTFLGPKKIVTDTDTIFRDRIGVNFMSIDIDSHDAQVWEAMRLYRPKVLLIEINSTVPVGVEQLHGDGREGNSFTTMMGVAKRKGYTLAAHTGNLVFVLNELAPLLRLPPGEYERPETIFNPMWVGWGAK